MLEAQPPKPIGPSTRDQNPQLGVQNARRPSVGMIPPTWDPHVPFEYERVPPRRNLGFGCCASSRKPVEANAVSEKQIWDTANLGWWDLYRRRWRSLMLMRNVYNRLKALEAETDKMEPGAEVDRMWDECHKLSAKEIREHAENAKGLFIKCGQFMSSLAGILPDPYVHEFQVLTEDLPVSSLEEVFRTIRRDLKRSHFQVFSEFSPEPIASASIAQVHKAKLRSNDMVVAVKIQHEGVDNIFIEDVSTLSSIAEKVAFWMPSLDFRNFCAEWADSLPRELNFDEERRALERASSALQAHGNVCVLPKVFKQYTGKHVLVMEFIEADPIAKLGDGAFCEEHGIDKHVVLTHFLNAFGIMAFKDGLFHADPHAGNVRILLDRDVHGGARPVLFDWGFFREISDEERMGLAKVFHCVANMDMAGLFDVLAKLGCKFRPEVLTDDFMRDFLEKARSLMKDTIDKQSTRQDMIKKFEDYKARLKREGDNPKFSPLHFLEEWPRCVVFFFRMLQIVRGLCVSVDATGMPVLDIFAQHAREALVDGSTKLSSINLFTTGREAMRRPLASLPASAPAGIGPGTSVVPACQPSKAEALERQLQARLAVLKKAGKIVGAQVAVAEDGKVICDVAYGCLSSIDARPVSSTTRFPVLGAAAGLASIALIRTLRRKHQQWKSNPDALKRALHVPVCSMWPQVSNGDCSVTLSQLLSHRAGVQDLFPENFGPRILDDIASVTRHFEEVAKLEPREPRYAYLLQAFLLAKLGDAVTGKDSLLHWLGSELAPLGLDIAAPVGKDGEASVCRDVPSLARVSMNEVSQGETRRKKRDAENETSTTQVKATEKCNASCPPNARTLLEAVAHDPLSFDPLQANTGSGGCFRAGLSLGASARSLVTMLSNEDLQKDFEALEALMVMDQDPTAIGWLLTGGACTWTAGGLQVFDLRGGLFTRQRGFGVACGLGPCVVHFPGLGRGGVTVGVMLNDVLRGREVAADLFSEVLRTYGYTPEWPEMPMRVIVDAMRLKDSPEAEPLMKSLGGLGGLKLLRDGFKTPAAIAAPPNSLLEKIGSCCSTSRRADTDEPFSAVRLIWQRVGKLCSTLCYSDKSPRSTL